MSNLTLVPQETLEPFTTRIEQEFIDGSGIAPSLFRAAIEIVPDQITLPGGEVETPIHDALNWRVVRFGYQVKETLYAAIFRNEDGSPWQANSTKP
ncbi:hypothetical protein HC928_11760 [bacterium]|nr:hypothetical protein [bacterium]